MEASARDLGLPVLVALVVVVSTAWAHVRVLLVEPVDDEERSDTVGT